MSNEEDNAESGLAFIERKIEELFTSIAEAKGEGEYALQLFCNEEPLDLIAIIVVDHNNNYRIKSVEGTEYFHSNKNWEIISCQMITGG